MKQIERKDSPQRVICELLERSPGMTIAEISAARAVHARAVARQLDALTGGGWIESNGYPQRYTRTGKPLPAVVSRTPKSELHASRRRQDLQALDHRLVPPAATDLDRVFAQWRGNSVQRA